MSEITLALQRMKSGEPRAADDLMNLVYGELRRLAAHQMVQEAAAHTLQPTALVHEAWLFQEIQSDDSTSPKSGLRT